MGNGFDSLLPSGAGTKKKIGERSKLSVAWGRKEAGGARSLCFDAAQRIAHLLLSCNTYVNNMSIWYLLHLSNYDVFYACMGFNNICAQLGIFRGMGNTANQLMTLDSGIIEDVRHQNKVYNHPPPPLPLPFFPSQATLRLPIFYLAPLHL